ncbi:recombinase-like helix-turn-helix domain-containing protein [Hydrogenophaga defluvii]|uniref:Recombinase-like helix-turn-helix domain-containing protein n=1 Tax=Hydrogenophaga defluvii TaxID=249410 RepID=A0ABW2SBI8_9BURK
MLNRTLYNETHQNRTAAPTAYEGLLGDSIERAFAAGIHDLEGLVAFLNEGGPAGPNGQPWTTASYQQEMARLGA